MDAGYRRLACEVINDAILTMTGTHYASGVERLRAKVFLTHHSPLLAHWCQVAGIDEGGLIERAQAGRLTGLPRYTDPTPAPEWDGVIDPPQERPWWVGLTQLLLF